MMEEMGSADFGKLKLEAGPSEFAPAINEGFVPDYEPEVFTKPPSAPAFDSQPQENAVIVNLPELTEEEIREACTQYVSEHCCYGTKFVKNMVIPQILDSCAFHYRLESLGESRETKQVSVPYKGGPVDGPENGAPPEPWEMPVIRPDKFTNLQTKYEIPHTAFVKACSKCMGSGRIRCSSCDGVGSSVCWGCGGSGRRQGNRCTSCSGRGRNTCWTCGGSGRVTCDLCDGSGKLRRYTMLIVTWKNHVDDFISDTSDLPKELILEASGKIAFSEEKNKVRPICHAPDATVNVASTSFVRKHETQFPNELILKQKHVLRAVPCTKVRYGWKSKVGEFYVYGFQKKVYFEDYPQKCCCCTCL